MSSAQRTAVIALAVVVLGVGFVIAQGGDDAQTPTTSAAATTATTTPSATTGAAATTATTTAAAPAPKPAVKTVTVSGGKPTGGVQKLTFAKGDTVRFRVKSDVADEIHVHGYDLMKDVTAGGSVSFSFKASIDGIFEVELENAGVQIASLKVTT